MLAVMLVQFRLYSGSHSCMPVPNHHVREEPCPPIKEAAAEFLASKRIVVTGVSRKGGNRGRPRLPAAAAVDRLRTRPAHHSEDQDSLRVTFPQGMETVTSDSSAGIRGAGAMDRR